MRIVIGGSRNYNNYEYFMEKLDLILSEFPKETIIILSGHCRGVDMLAERYAKERGIKLEIFPAHWSTYGKAAGPLRNKAMVENADTVIAFWDGISKGTKSLIDHARKQGRDVNVINIL